MRRARLRLTTGEEARRIASHVDAACAEVPAPDGSWTRVLIVRDIELDPVIHAQSRLRVTAAGFPVLDAIVADLAA